MKILVDVDALERDGRITPEVAAELRSGAARDVGSTAISFVLGFGAVSVAAGLLALTQSLHLGAVLGAAFAGGGWAAARALGPVWERMGSIWIIVGALMFTGSVAALIETPLPATLVATALLFAFAVVARSRLLIVFAALSLEGAVGGGTGYWHASYAVIVREPTLTIALFTLVGTAAFLLTQRLSADYEPLALTFARISVVVVNFGFWIGSLWGDTPGAYLRDAAQTWGDTPQLPALDFVVAWAVALVAAGAWAASQGRRFLVNAVAVFGAIHAYTQWFERLGANPLTVVVGGLFAIAVGLGLWRLSARS